MTNTKNKIEQYIRILFGLLDLVIEFSTRNKSEKQMLQVKTISTLELLLTLRLKEKLSKEKHDELLNILGPKKLFKEVSKDLTEFMRKNVEDEVIVNIYIQSLEELTREYIELVHGSLDTDSKVKFDKKVNQLYLTTI